MCSGRAALRAAGPLDLPPGPKLTAAGPSYVLSMILKGFLSLHNATVGEAAVHVCIVSLDL